MILIMPIKMNMLNIPFNKYLTRYILIFLGLIMFLGYLWFRFIRERLPKDIPFTLSLVGFIVLVYLCLIYMYIIYRLLYRGNSNNPLIKKLIDFIYKPLETLDEAIKNHPIVNPYYKRLLDSFPNRFGYLFKEPYYFYYCFGIYPRLILVTTLYLDIFYFHCLSNIYNVLFLSMFLLFNRYIKHSLKYAKEHIILHWETLISDITVPYVQGVLPAEIERNTEYEDPNDEDYDDFIPETMNLPLKRYVDFRSYAFVHYNYICDDTTIFSTDKYRENYRKKYNIKGNGTLKGELYRKERKDDLERIMEIPIVLEQYNYANDYDPKIKRLKILIYTNYLLCWLYILIRSVPSLPDNTFNFLYDIITYEEPFSLLSIEYTDMVMNIYLRSFILILIVIINVLYAIKEIRETSFIANISSLSKSDKWILLLGFCAILNVTIQGFMFVTKKELTETQSLLSALSITCSYIVIVVVIDWIIDYFTTKERKADLKRL